MKLKHRTPYRLSHFLTAACSLLALVPALIIAVYFYTSVSSTLRRVIVRDMDSLISTATRTLSGDLDLVNDVYYTLISDPLIHPELYNHLSYSAGESPITPKNITDRLQRIMSLSYSWDRTPLVSASVYFSPIKHDDIVEIVHQHPGSFLS